MMQSKPKASASMTIIWVVGVLIAGFLLVMFTPQINDFRIEALSNADSNNIVENLLLYALMPVIWGGYVLFSYLVLFRSVGLPGL